MPMACSVWDVVRCTHWNIYIEWKTNKKSLYIFVCRSIEVW